MFAHIWLTESRYVDVAKALSRLRATLTGSLRLTPLHSHPSISPRSSPRSYPLSNRFSTRAGGLNFMWDVRSFFV